MPDNWKSLQDVRRAGRPTAAQLQTAAREKRRQKRDCYDEILDKVYGRVSAKAKLGWVRVLYEVPSFVVGLPPYDTVECVKHLARCLSRDGYLVEVYGHVLYVSWDPREKSAADNNGGR